MSECHGCHLPAVACACHIVKSGHAQRVYTYHFATQSLTVTHGTRTKTYAPIPPLIFAHQVLVAALDRNEREARRWLKLFMSEAIEPWESRGIRRVDVEEVRDWLAFHRTGQIIKNNQGVKL